MDAQDDKPVNMIVVSRVPAYATALGVLALIAAILAFLIPVLGTLYITPVAILFGLIALWGGSKGLGIATFIILVVKLVISPTFWLSIWFSKNSVEAVSYRILSLIVLGGLFLMFVLLFKKNKSA